MLCSRSLTQLAQSSLVSRKTTAPTIDANCDSCHEVHHSLAIDGQALTCLRELYMKTGQGFLLVFSITSQSSFYELAELREQIKRIKEDDNVPMVLIGNKSDLEEDRAIPRPRAFAISREWNIPYFETSARRRANVDEAFVDLCRQIILKDQANRRYVQAETPSSRPGRPRKPAKSTLR